MNERQHRLKEQIRKLTAKIEQAHSNKQPAIDSAVWRASRDVLRRQLLQISKKANYEKSRNQPTNHQPL